MDFSESVCKKGKISLNFVKILKVGLLWAIDYYISRNIWTIDYYIIKQLQIRSFK